MSREAQGPGEPAPASALQEILSLERALAERLAAARAEAERIVREAREQARQRIERLEERTSSAVARLRHQLETQRDARLREIESTAEAECARYRTLSPQQLDALADGWVAELVRLEEEETA